jgi:hypothetical protein
MTKTSDQPSVQPPTREQIAPLPDAARMDAYYYGFERTGVGFIDAILSAVAIAGKGAHHTESWGAPWEGTTDYFRGHPGLPDAEDAVDLIQKAAQQAADAVLALFPRPAPSAEAERTYTAADVQEAFERGCVRGEQDANDRNWSRQQYEKMHASLPSAGPVSAADMAPGTTFTAEFKETGTRVLFVKVGGMTAWPFLAVEFGTLATYTGYAIDPSTIRDVTPPPATPEEGDR